MEEKRMDFSRGRRRTAGALLLAALLVFTGCSAKDHGGSADLFQHKGTWVGDASTVGQLARSLPGGESMRSMELSTGAEPYGILLHYDALEEGEVESAVETAAHLFALVRNVSWIRFGFQGGAVELARGDLERWLGDVVLYDVGDEEALQALLQEPMATRLHEVPFTY